MGFFGTFVYRGGQWAENADLPSASPYLRLDIHDSDIAQVDFGPTEAGEGRFYLGFEPAVYFEDPDASQPVDAAREARGFSTWAAQVMGVTVESEQVLPLLADPDGAEPEDTFVEDTVVRLLRLLNIPVPQQLQQDA
jgi:hypothetical protein